MVRAIDTPKNTGRRHGAILFACLSLVALWAVSLAIPGFSDDRTVLHAGLNLFSPEQDIALGQRVARQVPREFPLLNNRRVDAYLERLGLRLAAHAPGYKYPYTYRAINTDVINAFALPGGFIYINRGVIENVDNEAQLAAVMAHETSHVALRHGTNQATKAFAAQAGLSLLGALTGNSTAASFLEQLVGGVGVPLVFLKMSRTDESQADILGTQILHDAGYDPQAMANLFRKLEAQSRNQAVEFFSDHPSPEHRVERVEEEIARLSVLKNPRRDSREFEAIKRYVKSLPPPPKRPANAGGSGPSPQAPSVNYTPYSHANWSLVYPDNWRAQAEGGGVTLAPEGGRVKGSQGLAYGVMVGVFSPARRAGHAPSLGQATDQLVSEFEKSNPGMSLMRSGEAATLGGLPALSTYLESESPSGGREADWVITTLRPNGLLYVICIAPQKDFNDYDAAFRAIVHSLKFLN